MSKEKQIEEMARFVCSTFHGHHDCENCSLYEERCCVSFCAARRLYNAGYRKQIEGEWISVGDRLPEPFETVLVFCDTGVRKFQCVSEMIEPDGKRWSAVCGFRVTHWMPLPEPPKGD